MHRVCGNEEPVNGYVRVWAQFLRLLYKFDPLRNTRSKWRHIANKSTTASETMSLAVEKTYHPRLQFTRKMRTMRWWRQAQSSEHRCNTDSITLFYLPSIERPRNYRHCRASERKRARSETVLYKSEVLRKTHVRRTVLERCGSIRQIAFALFGICHLVYHQKKTPRKQIPPNILKLLFIFDNLVYSNSRALFSASCTYPNCYNINTNYHRTCSLGLLRARS